MYHFHQLESIEKYYNEKYTFSILMNSEVENKNILLDLDRESNQEVSLSFMSSE